MMTQHPLRKVRRMISSQSLTMIPDEFDILLSPKELKEMKDDFREVRYEKIHDLLLPEINGLKYYDWLAARMRNYMIYII